MVSAQHLFLLVAALVASVALNLSGCAGFRGGWDSVAYIGDRPPAEYAEVRADRAARPPVLRLPGVDLAVSIDNRLRTYDTQVYLFALPLSVDPRNVYSKNVEPGKTRVFVTVTPSEPGFVFRPGAAVLHVEGRRFTGVEGFEFGMWTSDWERVTEGGIWDHRPVGEEFRLLEPGRKYLLSVDFDTLVPSPESAAIALDLGRALASPHSPAIPLIRFAPVRWKEGYT